MRVFTTKHTVPGFYKAAALLAAFSVGSVAFAAAATNAPANTPMGPHSSGLSAALPTGTSTTPSTQLSIRPNYVVSTEVREVRSQSINGSQVLTLQINGVAGPLGCQSSTVTLRSSQTDISGTDHDLEALALRAMLNAEEVFISVPASNEHCIDGRPTVTDLWLRDTPSIG